MTKPITLVVGGPAVGPGDVPVLCARLGELHAEGATEVVCDVGGVTEPDLTAVEALARLRLTARRLGCRIRIRHPTPLLHRLLAQTGLAEALGEPEEREPALGVEERVQTDDPAP
ncbi:STAS domain-containing protein [Streptomyces sannanensis]